MKDINNGKSIISGQESDNKLKENNLKELENVLDQEVGIEENTIGNQNPRESLFDMQQKILEFWKDNKIFEKSLENRNDATPYRFYDGPPFITGNPHYGTLLSSIIKDIIPRYQTMKGKRVERARGWDCHGLPIEQKVQKALGLESNKEIEEYGIEEFVKKCYEYTKNTSAEWEWYIDNIGRRVDFKNAYKTMDNSYMESVIWVFKELFDKGLVYKGKRVSLYSTKLSTPISNFEVSMDNSYIDKIDRTVTVSFDLSLNGKERQDTSVLFWTTTPWTIPANVGLAINEKLSYVRVKLDNKYYIVAKNRVDEIFNGNSNLEIVDIDASRLIGLKYKPAFDYYSTGDNLSEDAFRIHNADFVNDQDGTGITHIAPEFGDVDFDLGKKHGLCFTEALDEEGKFTNQISDYKGMFYESAIDDIIKKLDAKGELFQQSTINHSVPICPRSGVPLIYKAQEARFVDIQNEKANLITKNEDINWYPGHLKEGRFKKSIETAPDWCISRNRFWGTPMPVRLGSDKDGNIVDTKVFGSIEDIKKESNMDVVDLHRPYIDRIQREKGGITYKRIPEVLDVWMDSGSMPMAQYHFPFENKEKFESSFPADYVSEYIGQVRARYYVMHVVSVLLFDKAPFKNVLTTGVIFGTDGRKMSKSYNNYPDPKGLIQEYGADAVRIYLAGSPLLSGNDINFDESHVLDVVKKYINPFKNAFNFYRMYADIDSYKANTGDLSYCNIKNINKDEMLDNNYDVVYIPEDEDFSIDATNIEVVKYDELIRTATKEYYEIIKQKHNGKKVLFLGSEESISSILSVHYNSSSTENEDINTAIYENRIIKVGYENKHNIIDKRIESELIVLVKELNSTMDNYNLAKSLELIEHFLEKLTNGYIRKSRKRFRKAGKDTDKDQAYDTLYNVLLELSKVTAPFMPFLSEYIYKGLNEKESVHLEDYPDRCKGIALESISNDIKKMDDVIALGLSWRKKHLIKLRQPLSSIKTSIDFSDPIKEYLRGELNVKDIIYDRDLNNSVKKICKPDSKILGPRLKNDFKFVLNQAKEGNFEEIGEGKIKIGSYILEDFEYEIINSNNLDDNLISENGILIEIDPLITDELRTEGKAREIVRYIQTLRKEVNYTIGQRINIYISGEGTENLISKFKEYIEGETLSYIQDKRIESPDKELETNLDGQTITLLLKAI